MELYGIISMDINLIFHIMKRRNYLQIIALLVLSTSTSWAVQRCCPPTDLIVSQSGNNPVRLTFTWRHTFPPPTCAPIIGFEVKAHVNGMGSNSNIEFFVIDGVEPLSAYIDVPSGTSVTWKVRSVRGENN